MSSAGPPRAGPAILLSLGVTAGTLLFGRVQNRGYLVGGDISLAKTLWLNLTILTFLILPAVWWRDRRVDPAMRRIFGLIFASFLIRAAVELPIIYLTDWWRCSFGIAHDVLTAGLAIGLYARSSVGNDDGRDSKALLILIVSLLFVEAGFAYAFCAIADPGAGTYFASNDTMFQNINRATWAAVAGGYTMLVAILMRTALPASAGARSSDLEA